MKGSNALIATLLRVFLVSLALSVIVLLIVRLVSKNIPATNKTLTNAPDILKEDINFANLTVKKKIKIDTIDDIRGLGYTGQLKIQEDSAGNVYVGYRKKYQGKEAVFVPQINVEDEKTNYTDRPIQFISGGYVQRVPSILIGSNGSLYAVWYGTDSQYPGNQRQIKFSRSEDNGETWSAWINIAPVTGYETGDYWQEHPMIIQDSDENLYVFWEGVDANTEEQQVKFSVSTDNGKTWSSWKNLQPNKDFTQSRPAAISIGGTVYVGMYSKNGEDTQNIWLTQTSDGGKSWKEWTNISRNSNDNRHLALSTSQNQVNLAWRSGNDQKLDGSVISAIINGQQLTLKPKNKYAFFPSISSNEEHSLVSFMSLSDQSEFPRENPEAGSMDIYLIDNTTGATKDLSASVQDLQVLYPNILISKTKPNTAYLVYETPNENGSYDVILASLLIDIL